MTDRLTRCEVINRVVPAALKPVAVPVHALADVPSTYLRPRIAAVLGEHAEAVSLLQEAYRLGWVHTASVHLDVDFEPLRDRPEYQELMRPKG